MTFDSLHLLHQALFGGIAAAGFGVLFNFSLRDMPLCFLAGATALTVRTLGLDAKWSLEAASFAAAVGVTLLTVGILRHFLGVANTAMAVIGCIPMVPGAFLAQSILGLFALTAPESVHTNEEIVTALQALLRVLFTLMALGAGISIPVNLLKNRNF